jgi:periplasmic protein TonB
MPEHQARSGDSSPSQPVAFQFKVTWSALYAKFPETSGNAALVKSSGSGVWNRPAAQAGAGWSMVVPKMQRMPPRRARVLEIPAPGPKALPPIPSKVVESRELLAFFGPAAALAACLALLLIQFVPKQRMMTVQLSDIPRFIFESSQPAVVPKAAEPVKPAAEVAVRRPVKIAPVPRLEPAPAVTEPPRATELPELPAPPVRLAEPAVYRPEVPPMPMVSEGFESSRVLKKVKPVYPETATNERVQGTVRLKATIGKDGMVEKVMPESGPPLLFDAASTAVRQWTFLPARLNGDPVEDVIHINIGFAIVSPGQQSQR